MPSRVAVEIKDGVAEVRLTRPDKLNALDDAMFDGLIEAGQGLIADPRVRAVVLSGEGEAFCAGLDVASFTEGGRSLTEIAGELGQRRHGIANRLQYAVWVWREAPFPVIAAAHGVAYGGGFQLLLGADIRLVTPTARLAILEIKWGLVPDLGGTQLMRHLAREDVIRELTYTGRVFSGLEACQMGFATRACDDPRAEALALAAEIAARSPDAVRAAKRLFNNAPYRTAAEGLIDESFEQSRLIGAPNQIEAVLAALQKRAPKFSD